MSVAVGVAIVALEWRRETLRQALGFAALVLLAMAAGRALGMVLDGGPNVIMYLFLVAELVAGVAALMLRSSVE
jgi:hypothetical protein